MWVNLKAKIHEFHYILFKIRPRTPFLLRLSDIESFDWDTGNSRKNIERHKVFCQEAEEVFFYYNLNVGDEKHSGEEVRYKALGKTQNNRYLVVVYTKRKGKIRVISARDANKKERSVYKVYEQKVKTDSTI
jgi:uncharacterized protein